MFRPASAVSARLMLNTLPPDFWRLWSVGLIASVVRWVEMVAVGVVVYDRTGSAFTVALITMLRMLPMGLFGAFVGTLADRFDRRRSLAAVTLLLALTSGVLAAIAAAGALEVWHLAVASLINGIGWVIDIPVRRMLMGESVGRERMGQAMALDIVASNASRMVGPALGGFLLAGAGIEGAFGMGALMYVAAIIATLSIEARIAPAAAAGAVLARTIESFRIALADRRIAATLSVTVIFNLFGWPFTSMIPVIGRDQLGLGPEGVGILTSVDGVGACIGALALAWALTPRWHRAGYVGGVALYLTALAAFALSPAPLPAGLALIVTGIGGAGFATLQTTIVYLAAPVELRSRMLGVLSVCIGTGPLGFLWLGWLADRIGAPEAVAVTGGLGLTALALTFPLWRRI
ncbi:MFS transporter [Desertibaculum subflavum]|uniref:MFS transporter n=1 Tax=Desertibaculum subflavum TaxID=2268458 RepID=UPI000E66B751